MQAAAQAKYKTSNEFTDTQLLKTSIYDVADSYIPYSSYVSTPECYVFKHNKKILKIKRKTNNSLKLNSKDRFLSG